VPKRSRNIVDCCLCVIDSPHHCLPFSLLVFSSCYLHIFISISLTLGPLCFHECRIRADPKRGLGCIIFAFDDLHFVDLVVVDF